MLKVGLVGVGHLGKIHLKLLDQSQRFGLIGIYDNNQEEAKRLGKLYDCKVFDTYDALLQEIEVIDVVTPTPTHYEYAKIALEQGKHLFVEKPICEKTIEAEELIALADKNKLKAQVGHVERFNPAFVAAKGMLQNPMFVEVHRLALFNPRGNDVSVVLDLMIHDLDIVLSSIDSEVVDVQASGVNVLSQSPDIANVRLAFANGAVANLTASRISMKNMRKARFFQKEAYLSLDFYEKTLEQVLISDEVEGEEGMVIENYEGQKKSIRMLKPKIEENNAILCELESLADAIEQNTRPKVDLKDGYKALKIAQEIIDKINLQHKS